MLDLESVLGRFGKERTVLGLLAGVLRIPAGDAVLADQGGVSGLTSKSPTMPGLEGILDAGRHVEEIGRHLDSSELYIGVASAVRTALSLYDAHMEWAVGIGDLEDEHGRDAVTRLVGLGLIAEGLCEGDSDTSTAMWLGTESGRAALAWFAAIEIILAYSTEDDPVDGDKLIDLLDLFFDDAIAAWTDLTNPSSLARSRVIVNNWTDVLCPAITACAPHVEAIADVIRTLLPSDVESDHDALVKEAESIRLYLSLCARHLGETMHGLGAPPAESESDESPVHDDSLTEALAHAEGVVSNLNSQLEQRAAQFNDLKAKGDALSEQQHQQLEAREKVSDALDGATIRQEELRQTGADTDIDGFVNQLSESKAAVAAAEEELDSLRSNRDALAESVTALAQAIEDLPAAEAPLGHGVEELEEQVAEARRALDEHQAVLAEAKGEASANQTRVQGALKRATKGWKASAAALEDALAHQSAFRKELSSSEQQGSELAVKQGQLKVQLEDLNARRKELLKQEKAASAGAAPVGTAVQASANELKKALSQHKERQAEAAAIQEQLVASQQTHATVRQMLAEAIDAELVQAQKVHRLCVQMRTVRMSGNDADVERVAANVLRMDGVVAERAGIKERLLAVRKERRSAGRNQTSSSKTVEAKTLEIEHSKTAHDAARKGHKSLLSRVNDAKDQVKAGTKTLRKREHRVTSTASMVIEKDQAVQDIGEQIAETRSALAEIQESQLRWRAAEEELRLEELKEVRRALTIAKAEWESADQALGPLRESASALRLTLEKALSIEAVHIEKQEACRQLTQSKRDELSVASSRYEHSRKTAKAAVDMLKNNARRLEDAHIARNDVQSTLDALRSEQSSRKSNIERADDQILEGNRAEELAQETVESCAALIEKTRAALASTAEAIVVAQRNAEAERVERIAVLGEEIRQAKARIGVIQESIVEAREDLEGLVAAEQRVVEAKLKYTEQGKVIQNSISEVQQRRAIHQKRHNAVSKVIAERSAGLNAVSPGIAGAQLTIRALESNRVQRATRLSRARDRLVQLESMIEVAQSHEDEAVEDVADIQSWIDRSNLALERCLAQMNEQTAVVSAPPVLPKAKDRETQAKVDKLVNRTKGRSESDGSQIIPDPSAAPDVDEAATMMFINPAHTSGSDSDSDAATAIFEVSAKNQEPVEEDDADAATLIFSREDLLAKLKEEDDDARTSMMSREEMQAYRNRKNQED